MVCVRAWWGCASDFRRGFDASRQGLWLRGLVVKWLVGECVPARVLVAAAPAMKVVGVLRGGSYNADWCAASCQLSICRCSEGFGDPSLVTDGVGHIRTSLKLAVSGAWGVLTRCTQSNDDERDDRYSAAACLAPLDDLNNVDSVCFDELRADIVFDSLLLNGESPPPSAV
jgi:hypothetical protein